MSVPRTSRSRSPDPALVLRSLAGDDEHFPASLGDLPVPLERLWYLGDAALLRRAPAIAIVGTRDATPYGMRVATDLARAFARAGALVVSGMARGIDAAAHRAALDAQGATVAVLGTGADVPYPAGHRALHHRLAREGLVISQFPPGMRAFRGCFPRRNQVIAALSGITIVVEAGFKSGALLTAHASLDLGRVVAAVPGPIDSPQSQGTNELLRDGAVVITSAADALQLAGLTPVLRQVDVPVGDPKVVWDALAKGAVSMDLLCTRSGLPVQRCLVAVTELELRGLVECRLTGEVARR
ncbi:MAG TPA: DNA-processing protein DprA [Gemmatimonadaceae bacterium]